MSAEAVTLLLEVLDLEEPNLSGAVAELSPGPVAVLATRGLLAPHGYEAVSASQADHDDVPVALIPAIGGLAYFSSAAGLTQVPAERLTRYQVGFSPLFSAFGGKLDWAAGRSPRQLVDGLLWELGEARLGKRPARTPIWFARRLWEPAARRQVEAALSARPYPGDVVLLCSSRPARLQSISLPGAIVVAIRDVLAADNGLAVSPEILDARLRGVAMAPSRGPLDLSPDGTRLRIGNGDPIPFKSADQIAAIKKLVAAYYANKRLRIGELTHHGSLARLFGREKWALLKPHIKSVNRLWGFDL
ncbi:hypothetical protein [Siccirubricoccus phaeus]|uniref:hypothetical protein n=1 Tax=Siccirubricoccus phaeus TaxID=2595053 RepID=UPI00165C2E34|nr:hypothetical protein [Siccirubricoccus phaeus]